MKKTIQQILSGAAACVLAAVLLAGCAADPSASSSASGSSPASAPAKSTVRVQTIKGPTGIGMVGLMDGQGQGHGEKRLHLHRRVLARRDQCQNSEQRGGYRRRADQSRCRAVQ